LITYIEVSGREEEIATIVKLADLNKLQISTMKKLGIKFDK